MEIKIKKQCLIKELLLRKICWLDILLSLLARLLLKSRIERPIKCNKSLELDALYIRILSFLLPITYFSNNYSKPPHKSYSIHHSYAKTVNLNNNKE